MTPFGYLFDCLDLELIRVPLAAHADLLGCHKLWLEDVYERLAGPARDEPDCVPINGLGGRLHCRARARRVTAQQDFIQFTARAMCDAA